MQRLAFGYLMMLAACGPGAPQDGPTSTDSDATSTSTSSTGATTSSTSTTQTTDAPTTGSTTTEASTTTDGLSSSTTGSTSSTSTTDDTTTSPSTTTDSGTTGEPGPCCVAPDEPTSSVQAITPVGAMSLPWAVYSIYGAECSGEPEFYLHPEAAGVDTNSSEQFFVDHLKISLVGHIDMWPDEFIGTGPASISALIDGQSASTEGEITILEKTAFPDGSLWCAPGMTFGPDGHHISFTIALKTEDWDITGEVLANFCPALSVSCP